MSSGKPPAAYSTGELGMTYALGLRQPNGAAPGSTATTPPVVIAIELPRTPGPDEPAQLRALAFELGERLVIERGKRWLSRRLLFGR